MKILKDCDMLDDISSIFLKSRFYEIKAKILAKYDNFAGEKIDYSMISFISVKNNSKPFINHKIREIEQYFEEIEESKNIL